MKNIIPFTIAILILIGLAIATVSCIQAPLELIAGKEELLSFTTIFVAYAFLMYAILTLSTIRKTVYEYIDNMDSASLSVLSIFGVLFVLSIIGHVIRLIC